MATRTQKAAKKAKAEEAMVTKAKPTPKVATPKAKVEPKQPKAPTPKAAQGAKAPKAKPGKSEKSSKSSSWESVQEQPDAKPTLGERFWHRIGMGAKAKEERAHKVHLDHEARVQAKIEQDNLDRERAEEEQRAAHKLHDAADRKAAQKSAREMARIAREEDARLKREAGEAEARAVEQAAEDRKAAAAARREQARVAKLQEAAEAQLAEQEKAEAAARAAEETAAAEAQAAEERAAKRREAAEARREKARQEKIDAEEKAAQRKLARQRKVEEKAREEELTKLEEEAQARRSAPKMDVDLVERDEEAGEDVEGESLAEDAEGEAVEAESVAVEPEEVPASRAAKGKDGKANGKEHGTTNGLKPSQMTDADAQADRVAEELRSRRSKPITIDADDTPTPMLPVGRKGREEEEPKQVLQLDPAPPARIEVAAPRGLSIPEHFLLLSLDEGWDERREKAMPGSLGGALVGSLLLELVLQGKLRVQRDRIQVTDVEVDAAAEAVAQTLAQWQERPSIQAMGNLAKSLPELLPPYKDRMVARGLIEHRAWRHLGMFYRSQTALVDGDAQERLRNKLARAIAGGGRPDAPTILSLGLLEACGLFGVVVPEGAQAYNRKRLNGLLAGKDVMGYKVDDELKGMQEMAVRTILDNVRLMTVRG